MKRAGMIVFIVTVLLIPTFEMVMAEKHIIVTRDDLMRVAKQIFPPGSNGKTADWCPLPTGAMMRQEILELLQQGLSDEEVIDTLVSKYGEQVLAAPSKKGFTLTLWVLPSVAVIFGLLVLSYFIWKRYKLGRDNPMIIETESNEEDKISVEEQREIEQGLRTFLDVGSGTDTVSVSLYSDLADLEYDYLLEKINRADYTALKATLYRQILVEQKRKERRR